MKKTDREPKQNQNQLTETGHNVDIPQRNPRSVENGQEALPTSPRHAGARTPRREVVRDAEGFQSVRVRRSPRHTDAEDEEGHFVPEAPARRPKATKRKAGFECLPNLEPEDAPPVVLPEPKFPEGHKDQKAKAKSLSKEARAALLRKALGVESGVSDESLVVSPAQHLKNLKKIKKAIEKSKIVRVPAADAPAPAADIAPLPRSSPDQTQEAPVYRKRLSDPVPLLSQFLTARVTSVEGDCLFDSILVSLQARARYCGWTFPNRLPVTTLQLRQALLDYAFRERAVPLPDGMTPEQYVVNDYVNGACAIRDTMWEAQARIDNPAVEFPQRFVVDFEDYLEAMSSPTANGDELIAALASMYFGVRIMIVGERLDGTFRLQRDCKPENVHRDRYVTLVHYPGHYMWAHPSRDTFHASTCGRVHGQIHCQLDEWMPRWGGAPPPSQPESAQQFLAGVRRELESRQVNTDAYADVCAGACAQINGENERENGERTTPPNTRVNSANTPQSTGAESECRNTRVSPNFPPGALAPFLTQAQEIAAALDSEGHEVAVDDVAAALYLTRNENGEANVRRAMDVLPGGRLNPLRVTPDSNGEKRQVGRRARENESKRQTSPHKHILLGEDQSMKEFAQKAAGKQTSASQQQNSVKKREIISLDTSESEGESEEEHRRDEEPAREPSAPPPRREIPREHPEWLGDEQQLKETAVSTIVAITGTKDWTAREELEKTLPITKSMQEAISECCRRLHPAALALTFIERGLGEGVKPATAKQVATHLAKSQSEITPGAPSALQPRNLQQRFFEQAAGELANPELARIPAPQRLAVATNRATTGQWREAERAATWQRDIHTPAEDTRRPSFRTSGADYHPSPAVRIAMAREQCQDAQRLSGAAAPVVVVGGGSTKLPVWLPGEEKDNRGFYWSTKQHIQSAWRMYMAAEGLYAPRTFKSLISPQLIPLICAETNIPHTDWEHISDRVLIERIESRLRPKNSADVITKLRELKISKDTSKGTLSQRYRVYAEAFLLKLAEAEECGCHLPETAIKQTFTSAMKQEPVLDSWIHDEKWSNVWDAHRRIVERLRDFDSWSVYDNMQRKSAINHVHVDMDFSAAASERSDSGHKRDRERDRSGEGRRERERERDDRRERDQESFIHALSTALINVAGGGGTTQGAPRRTSDYVHPGLDRRGPHWHKQSATIRCRDGDRCSAIFCQICGMHGHDAAACFKRERQMPGINLHGYFQESKPDSWPVRYEDGERSRGQSPGGALNQERHAPPPARSEVRFNNVASGGSPSPPRQRSSTAQRTIPVHEERQSRVNSANSADAGSGGSEQ